MFQVPSLEHVPHPRHQIEEVCGSPNPLLCFVGPEDAAEEDAVQKALEVLVSTCSPACNSYEQLLYFVF
jgi:hypothetical protein